MKRRILTLVAAAAMLLTFTAVPAAQADPPQQFDEPIFSLIPDTNYGVVVFWNITRDNFCDWVDGGEIGPPPVEELIPAMGHAAGPVGVFMGRYQATRHLELWMMDDPDNPISACDDTDGQSGPLGVGSAKLSGQDNDLDVSLTRTNSFGETGAGTVYEDSGAAWHYSWSFKFQIDRNDEFRIVNIQTNLKKKGK